MTYKILLKKQPVFLHSMLDASLPSRSLRSNNENSLSVARVKTNTGARDFYSCVRGNTSNLESTNHNLIFTFPGIPVESCLLNRRQN